MGSKKARAIVIPGDVFVLSIDGLRNVSQIAKFVIGFLTINVVNLELRPRTGHVQECKTRRSVVSASDVDDPVPASV